MQLWAHFGEHMKIPFFHIMSHRTYPRNANVDKVARWALRPPAPAAAATHFRADNDQTLRATGADFRRPGALQTTRTHSYSTTCAPDCDRRAANTPGDKVNGNDCQPCCQSPKRTGSFGDVPPCRACSPNCSLEQGVRFGSAP